MRSRYSAYAIGDARYLLATWHPSTRPRTLELEPRQHFTGLVILSRTGGGMLASEGTVEFRAEWLLDGEKGSQHERSRFSRVDGRWYYVDAA